MKNKFILHVLLASFMLPGVSWAKKEATLDLIIEHTYFSPNKDGHQDSLVVEIKTQRLKKVQNWEFRIQDDGGITKRTMTGVKKVPKLKVWNGLDDFGAAVSEGKYQVSLVVWDKKRGVVSATPVEVVVDLTPPTVSLNRDMKEETEDDSEYRFLISAVDLSGIESWKLEIQDPSKNPIHEEESSGSPPVNLSWTPKKDMELPPKGTAIVYVTDRAGNSGSSAPLAMTFAAMPSKPRMAVPAVVPVVVPKKPEISPAPPPPGYGSSENTKICATDIHRLY